jgi:hypothetical protein
MSRQADASSYERDLERVITLSSLNDDESLLLACLQSKIDISTTQAVATLNKCR